MKYHQNFYTAIGATVLAFATMCGQVQAQSFPSKPLTVIVPWSPGGGSDRSMRLVAATASKYFGQSVIVVNKPGAGGANGTRAIAAAKADGYTMGMVGAGVVARQYNNPNANPLSDLIPIAFFGADPAALSARASTGFKSVADFVKAAKSKPGSIKNGNDQPGGSSYVAIAIMEGALGVKTTRVPYKGYAPTVAALLAGEVQTATVPVPDAIEHHKAGKIRILGVAATQRHFVAPDVKTFIEQGFNVVAGSWRTIVAPAGVPAARAKVLEAKLLQTLKDPKLVKRANNAGFFVTPLGSKETAAYWKSYDKAVYPVLLSAGLVKTRKK
ncbi:MAG: tripartite tricarboxylate transporter substrate binding protein [Rhodospirillaceae bacterium]|jgi:tripartite-type tricarboxylate transporter receptor subunit TctC|nr:tripartite tricarboxylate transporter substrate binding protein [Rhodospirillaceae bacterium]